MSGEHKSLLNLWAARVDVRLMLRQRSRNYLDVVLLTIIPSIAFVVVIIIVVVVVLLHQLHQRAGREKQRRVVQDDDELKRSSLAQVMVRVAVDRQNLSRLRQAEKICAR